MGTWFDFVVDTRRLLGRFGVGEGWFKRAMSPYILQDPVGSY